MRSKNLNVHSKKSLPAESGSVKSTPLPDPGTYHSDAGGVYFMTYAEQLKSPKWQKKRLEILERDEFTCQWCGSKDEQLHVHHYFYFKDCEVWDYENYHLVTVCDGCHEWFHIMGDILKTLQAKIYSKNDIGMFKDVMFEFENDNAFFLKCHKMAKKHHKTRIKDLVF